jgi:hypothetical protein
MLKSGSPTGAARQVIIITVSLLLPCTDHMAVMSRRFEPYIRHLGQDRHAVGRQVQLFKPAECLWWSSRWNTTLGRADGKLCDSCSGDGACVRQGHGGGDKWRVQIRISVRRIGTYKRGGERGDVCLEGHDN